MAKLIDRLQAMLSRLSFRTGVVILVLCIIFYVISFAQMLLPISSASKGVLWFVFFGLAKTAQYSAIVILGAAGLAKIKSKLRRNS